ncbi:MULTISPECIES: accessory gene regulator ArgB-like protein [unclassified Romboutsia]|uniref:accessory gene regulator ArgB-like protein n=1 Tax=unclassified Romboutsia TaxID=2626894 RepID=UPI000822A8D7|nr:MULTISPECIES: accessory gene regulator B family protein [unclassified Romboutsia]SCH44981.1 putative accessory gene regulator protein [uncultured Clostridium sp.]
MFKSLSYKFADMLSKNDIIEDEDFEIYRYGFETLIYFIVNISVALFIGAIFDRFIHTIIFLTCYCSIRQFTGGYHARNYTECTLTFVVIYTITIFMANNININKYKYLLILFMIFSMYIIYKIAPQEHRNKPLSKEEKEKYKRVVMKIVGLISIIFIASILFNIFKEYIIYSLLAIIWTCILLLLGIYTK